VKRLIATAAAAGLTLTGLAAAAPSAGAAPTAPSAGPVQSIDWKQCPGVFGSKYHALCGFLSVPLDYRRPRGTQIKLAVSMIKHDPKKQYQGIMLTNPGGPGASGLTLSILRYYVPNDAAGGYDWIGFDPRGIGSSVPALQCDPDYFKGPRTPYVPTSKSIERTWLTKAKNYSAACAKNDKVGLLNHDKTTDTVADMESIRRSLGQKQINFYGFSYGTYLGQVYSTLHPKNVRRMVLDSNVDPRGVWYYDNLAQDVAFDRNSKIYFAWLAKYDSVFHLGTTERAVQKAYYGMLGQLTKAPKGTVGPDELTDVVQGAAYYRFGWIDIGNALSALVNKGDASGIAELYGNATPEDRAATDNGYVGYSAVQCTDVQWPLSWRKWQRDNWALYHRFPFLTWGNAWFNAPCLTWPAKAGHPVRIDGSKVAPALLIDETNDAATPYEGSLQVRRLFPKSVLLAEPGGATHADSLFGDACVDNTIADYLLNGTLPKRTGKAGYGADKICAPLPDPDPTAATAKAKSAQSGGIPRTPPRIRF
jgi:pimeloyl-ACP methyl ester carboxylesterase